MSRSHLLIVGEISFVTIVCIVAALLFRRQPAPVPTAVSVELKFPNSQSKVFLDQKDGQFTYLVAKSDGSFDRLAPDQMAAKVYDAEKADASSVALDIHNPVLLLWLSIGLIGQVLFTGRMVVQYIASHREGKSVVPPLFWWMSLIGSLLLLSYFFWRRDPIGLLGQAFGSFVYLKNILWIMGESRQPPALATAETQP